MYYIAIKYMSTMFEHFSKNLLTREDFIVAVITKT